MEEAPPLDGPPLTGESVDSPSYGYTNPITSFFNAIFFIIILVLVLVFIVILLFAQGVNYLTGGTTTQAPPPPAKEKFTGGPPYPSCRTNGALAMF